MAFKPWKVKIIGKGCASDEVIIEATNIPQARQFAEARYPGCKIGGIRTCLIARLIVSRRRTVVRLCHGLMCKWLVA